jgi:dTDP-4-amino-4,6-dideoxygalactose transaminase
MRVPFVNLQSQYEDVREAIDAALHGVLERSDYVLGEAVAAFERNFAAYCGTTDAVGVSSGYAALELILRAYDIGPGDEVITAANTFIATALPIAHCGARPVLVDIEPGSYNIDPALIEQAITPATRAILVVHLYGQPAPMAPILDIANKHGLLVFEDACQAHGARYQGARAGALGHAAAFSFYPTKNLGAFGDGGAVATNDGALAGRIRLLRNLGQRVKNTHEILGFNHRLDTLHAAILDAQLPRLDAWNALRRRAAARYGELLGELELTLPAAAPNVEHVYHLYVVRVRSRARLQASLEARGVATAIHYPTPLYLQPAFQSLGYRPGDFPVTEAAAGEILSLPMFPALCDEQIEYVAQAIRSAQRSL